MLHTSWEFRLAKCDGVDIDAAFLEHIAELDAAPFCSTHGTDHPMRADEDLVVAVMQVLTTVTSALEGGDDFMLWHLLQVLQLELAFLDSLSRDDQAVLLRADVGDCQVAPSVEELVWRDIVVRQQVDAWLAVEGLELCSQQIGVSNRIVLEHVSEVEVGCLLHFLLRKVTNAVLLHPIDHMASEMLAVDLPVWLQILSCSHHETWSTTWVTIEEEAEIVDAATECVPHVTFFRMLGHLFHREGGEVWAWRWVVELRLQMLAALLRGTTVGVDLDGLCCLGLGSCLHAG
mmetsp:Transcript_2166/g.6008  ORF Transcript_2166/g.6008 Transcript_2166/m.6008 type:complete len:289 (+) Transcript_2166:1070-1936(+)